MPDFWHCFLEKGHGEAQEEFSHFICQSKFHLRSITLFIKKGYVIHRIFPWKIL